jgi:hypothetical protein
MLLQRAQCRADAQAAAATAPAAAGARISTQQLLRRVPCRQQPFASSSRGDLQHSSRANVVSVRWLRGTVCGAPSRLRRALESASRRCGARRAAGPAGDSDSGGIACPHGSCAQVPPRPRPTPPASPTTTIVSSSSSSSSSSDSSAPAAASCPTHAPTCLPLASRPADRGSAQAPRRRELPVPRLHLGGRRRRRGAGPAHRCAAWAPAWPAAAPLPGRARPPPSSADCSGPSHLRLRSLAQAAMMTWTRRPLPSALRSRRPRPSAGGRW